MADYSTAPMGQLGTIFIFVNGVLRTARWTLINGSYSWQLVPL